jgi:uncharacterized protein
MLSKKQSLRYSLSIRLSQGAKREKVGNSRVPNWLTKIFRPQNNFYELLINQSAKTLEGVEALRVWVNGGAQGRCETVRALEHEADDIVADLEEKLIETFITPFDREDIYDLSRNLDEVINGAKSAVREIEALQVNVSEDQFMKDIVATLVEGTRCLLATFEYLEKSLPKAAEQAQLARRSENRTSKIYRQAVRTLFAGDDLKLIAKTKEIYNSLLSIAQRIDIVGVKLEHVIVKLR